MWSRRRRPSALAASIRQIFPTLERPRVACGDRIHRSSGRRPRSTAVPSMPFVGRSSDLAKLVSGLDAVLKGKGSTLVVRGEAGVGKSTLLKEFALAPARRVSWFLK